MCGNQNQKTSKTTRGLSRQLNLPTQAQGLELDQHLHESMAHSWIPALGGERRGGGHWGFLAAYLPPGLISSHLIPHKVLRYPPPRIFKPNLPSPEVGKCLLGCPDTCGPAWHSTQKPLRGSRTPETAGSRPAFPPGGIWLLSACLPDSERRPCTVQSLHHWSPLSPLVKGVILHCFCCRNQNFRMGPR